MKVKESVRALEPKWLQTKHYHDDGGDGDDDNPVLIFRKTDLMLDRVPVASTVRQGHSIARLMQPFGEPTFRYAIVGASKWRGQLMQLGSLHLLLPHLCFFIPGIANALGIFIPGIHIAIHSAIHFVHPLQ